MKRLQLDGQVFGRLSVLGCAGPDVRGAICWLCRCECGAEKAIRGADLKRGFVISCGCWNSERTSKNNMSHNGSATRLYRIWQAMKDRTGNPKAGRYEYYGGRGISVAAEWMDFAVFQQWALSKGYAPELSIDRVNNDQGYSPSNCRWATQSQQVRNRRPRSEWPTAKTKTMIQERINRD